MIEKEKRQIGFCLRKLEQVDSTNDEIKRLAREQARHGTAVMAKRQTKGRGRRGRTWESSQEDNIYLSVLLRPKLEPQYASMLTLVAALSVAETLEAALGEPMLATPAGISLDKKNSKEHSLQCQIKWPNDIVLQGKKICGILTEMSMESDGHYFVVVGIGINVNTEQFPEELRDMATSLRKETGRCWDVSSLVENLLAKFDRHYHAFEQEKNLGFMLHAYNKRLVNRGREVKVLTEQGEKIRFSQGIDETGALLVEDRTGNLEKIISGEVSVRGLYGYV